MLRLVTFYHLISPRKLRLNFYLISETCNVPTRGKRTTDKFSFGTNPLYTPVAGQPKINANKIMLRQHARTSMCYAKTFVRNDAQKKLRVDQTKSAAEKTLNLGIKIYGTRFKRNMREAMVITLHATKPLIYGGLINLHACSKLSSVHYTQQLRDCTGKAHQGKPEEKMSCYRLGQQNCCMGYSARPKHSTINCCYCWW